MKYTVMLIAEGEMKPLSGIEANPPPPGSIVTRSGQEYEVLAYEVRGGKGWIYVMRYGTRR